MFLTLVISFFTFIELNCENLFDTQHDSLKNDIEFTPEGSYHWTKTRYWHKLNHISQELIALGEDSIQGWQLPDMVALCEVENDSVLRDLTKRSLLRKARYEYFITQSPDTRGIDVALMYQPISFRPIRHYSMRIKPLPDMRPTRDILYVCGQNLTDDTLHIFVVHAPSRLGGEKKSRHHRLLVAHYLTNAIDSIKALSTQAKIIVAGDFNDYSHSLSLDSINSHGMIEISENAHGAHRAKGTYRYHGLWGSLDHIICSNNMAPLADTCYIGDLPFLLEEDTTYGSVHPKRCYLGPRYQNGYSDHLPLVARFRYEEKHR
jgi:endonuclease/exonuclease/phosphatase family metal-dependent hydrolase